MLVRGGGEGVRGKRGVGKGRRVLVRGRVRG